MGRVEGTSFLAPNQYVENAGRFLSVDGGMKQLNRFIWPQEADLLVF